MQNSISFKDLAVDYLRTENLIHYEQLLILPHSTESQSNQQLLDSYKISIKALKSIELYLSNAGYKYQQGLNSRGAYMQISYDVFMILNAELNTSMQIIYASNGDEYGPGFVRIYYSFQPSLPKSLIKKYQSWVR